VAELANYHAVVVGVGTRFGRMASQMASFLDQAASLWMSGALLGKVGSAFFSAAAGLPYSFQGQMPQDEITGGSPYGITTVAAGDGSREAEPERVGGCPLPRPP
jgi:NAD(P)H dehydrogenase (quinone)